MSLDNKCFEFKSGSFNHNWLPRLSVKQVNSPSGRYYETPEGNHYTSVTTFLSSFNKDIIDGWRNAVGEEEANKVSKRAATRGTTLHENVEQYLKNDTVTIDKNRLVDVSLMKGIIPLLNRINDIRLLESPLYSHTFKLAGTVDCVASFDGAPSIIDFKTAGKLKDKETIENYFIQTSIYSWMVEERYGVKVPQLVILMSQEFGKPQVFIEHRKNWSSHIKNLLKSVSTK